MRNLISLPGGMGDWKHWKWKLEHSLEAAVRSMPGVGFGFDSDWKQQ